MAHQRQVVENEKLYFIDWPMACWNRAIALTCTTANMGEAVYGCLPYHAEIRHAVIALQHQLIAERGRPWIG